MYRHQVHKGLATELTNTTHAEKSTHDKKELIFKSELNSIESARETHSAYGRDREKDEKSALHILHVFEIFSLFVVDESCER